MSLQWWERVPKKNREAQLASMGEVKYLGILRKAALRQYKDDHDKCARLQQTALAKKLAAKPGQLRDMEAGHRPAPLKVCETYCELIGLPITVLQRVGKGKLVWDGDVPSNPAAPEPEPTKPRARRTLTEEEKERGRQARAAQRVLNGAQQSVDLSKATNLKLRNHLEYNLVVTVTQTDKGNLVIDVFGEGQDTRPSELLRNGYTGVRIPLPQVVVYDFDHKEKVTEASVPTNGTDDEA